MACSRRTGGSTPNPDPPPRTGGPMAPRAIISYDDTPGDHDALMLGRDPGRRRRFANPRVRPPLRMRGLLDRRSSTSTRPRRCSSVVPRWLADLHVDTRVVFSPSTPEGLRRLVEERVRGHHRVRLRLPDAAGTRRTAAHHPEPARVRAGGGGDRAGRLLRGPRGGRDPHPPHRRDRDPRRRHHAGHRARAWPTASAPRSPATSAAST